MHSKKVNLVSRPPIVVVMGHIDHGKSKILDCIRNTNVVERAAEGEPRPTFIPVEGREAGGITQHIGAYEAEIKGKKITFLDTPGHEAFSKMRQRGAKIADIAVLVIAGDEGIKPQTMEAYETIKEAQIPFVIAINKIDKPNTDPDRVKNQLSEKQIFVEGLGGKIPVVNVSAKTGEGINDLLDIILLLAEMENLKANPGEGASGFVVESHMDQKRGITATLLIQNGAMKKGMFISSGKSVAAVRIEGATFSSPVEIVGFDEMPEAGAEFKTFNTREEAEKAKIEPLSEVQKNNISEENKNIIIVSIILKTDVSGSLEALEKEITKKETENVKINILRKDAGNINEDDVKLALSAKNSIILGFNVKIDPSVKELAERFNVIVFFSNIIYEISDWLDNEIKEKEKSIKKEEIVGTAKILKTFGRTKNKQVVGGRVISGKIAEGRNFKIKRNDFEIGEGKILELQKNKTPIKEAKEADEFGVMVESKIELAKDDEIIVI